jgi:hypothetical protein
MGEESENSPFFEKLVIRISFLIVTKTTSFDGRRYIYQISDYPCITGLNLYPFIRLGPYGIGESVNLAAGVTSINKTWRTMLSGDENADWDRFPEVG